VYCVMNMDSGYEFSLIHRSRPALGSGALSYALHAMHVGHTFPLTHWGVASPAVLAITTLWCNVLRRTVNSVDILQSPITTRSW